ncbi:putative hydroxypyruvate isomerase isoform X2 [Diabrotica virgifera virgifera]|nr:putative hydroxypyruvate isomerase isoform X2 [Diabrotica virgifera virgifera]XP_050519400.1 putative hydroxypyruvate isomerase isoform X2 [Diabrotica virgifera virgifera]
MSFCANLGFLFKEENNLINRYKLAKQAGFYSVETPFPYGYEKDEVVAAKNAANVNQVLINIYTGDVSKGELGFAAIPGKEEEFKKSMLLTIEYAKALGVKKIHIMAGKIIGAVTPAHDTVYEDNLQWAVQSLEKEDIMGLIEPINKYSVPQYYLNSYERAVAVIKKINSPKLKLMLDIFHLQMIKGCITNSIEEMMPHIGHVQIAQAPNRNEPDSAGELDYRFILDILAKKGYNGWIGLEYLPKNETVEGLSWIKSFGFTLTNV